jgi:hypothetical protein
MTKANIDLSPEGRLYRQRIHGHLERLNLQRKLLVEQERDGADTKEARLLLRKLLKELEAMLSAHRTLVSDPSQEEA